mmetsp:Transcript_174651/g.560052  ORF Transcript_174651/g.560052 Transcript_174651/m.560052 type:complete len:141 (-) Transcript_174651:475-897(-)
MYDIAKLSQKFQPVCSTPPSYPNEAGTAAAADAPAEAAVAAPLSCRLEGLDSPLPSDPPNRPSKSRSRRQEEPWTTANTGKRLKTPGANRRARGSAAMAVRMHIGKRTANIPASMKRGHKKLTTDTGKPKPAKYNQCFSK